MKEILASALKGPSWHPKGFFQQWILDLKVMRIHGFLAKELGTERKKNNDFTTLKEIYKLTPTIGNANIPIAHYFLICTKIVRQL